MGYRYLGNRKFQTTIPVEVRIGEGENSLSICVPAGFDFNVSVPFWLRWPFNPHDHRYLAASAAHDYALHKLKWPREVAAAPFGVALRDAKVPRRQRLLMVLGVIAKNWK